MTDTTSAIPTDDVAAQRVGSTIKGKWRVDAHLGTGGMASVYAATHRNGQRAALKIMHAKLAEDPTIVSRFLGEGYVANKIGHSACVRVLDDDATEAGEPFLVMELLEGETLRDLWKRTGKRVPLPLVMHVAERVLDCLAACHDAGVVHRDLKPANIYVTRHGDVKLLDFGVALVRDSQGPTAGMAMGTPAYMSPEQAKGQADKIDHRVDIFSVGAVIHSLASGRRVHSARDEREALKMAATTPAPSVATIAPDLPARVVALIDRALAWDPAARFADAREMQAEVSEIEKSLKLAASRAVPSTSVETFHDADAPTLEALPGEHPRTARAKGVARALGEAIDSVATQGPRDADALEAVERAAEVVTHALAEEPLIVLEVRQASLFAMGHLAWVPSPSAERVPRELYASGVRALVFARGAAPVEVGALVRLLGSEELLADQDFATAIWDLQLPHVRAHGVVGFAAGDAVAREARATAASELETSIGQAQRKYALRLANPNLRAPKPAGPLAFDPDARARLEAALVLSEGALSARHTALMAAAMLDAAKHGEVPAVLGALRKWAVSAMGDGRHAEVMRAARALSAKLAEAVGPKDAPKLEGAVMSAAFGKEALVSALANLDESSRPAMAPVLARLGDPDWPAIVAALHRPMTEASAALLLSASARVLRAKHAELASRAQKTRAPVRRAVRAWLTSEGHPDAAALLPAARDGERPLPAAETSAEEQLVLALQALGRLASNRQQATAEFERRVGDAAAALAKLPRGDAGIVLEIAQSAVYVDGRLARLSQSGLDAAIDLGASLAKVDGARALALPKDVTADDLRRLGADLATGASTSTIRRVAVSDLARTFGADLSHAPIEQRLVATAAAATLAVRELARADRAGPRAETALLARTARGLVDDSEGGTAAFLGLIGQVADESSVVVGAAVLALAAAREITDDRATLAAVAMGALLSAVPRPALLAGLGFVDPASSAAVIAHESRDARGSDASFAGRLVAVCKRWVEARARASFDEATRALSSDPSVDADALRALFAGLGIVPAGTRVELSDGAQAEVLAANEEDGGRPRVRLASDRARVLELELEDDLSIARVVDTSGWKTGPSEYVEPPPRSARPEETSPKPASVRSSRGAELAPTAEGTLAATPLVHVLVYVLDKALNGTLEFREPDGTTHLVSLLAGNPTRVVTGRLISPLGAMLVAQGKLTDVQAASAITNAKAEGLALGRYLVSAGKLSGSELQRTLELQVRRKLAGLVNLPDAATFTFYQDVDRLEPAPSAHQVEVDTLDVILDCVRAWTARERIDKTLARYAKLPLALHADSTAEVMELDERERALLGRMRQAPVPLTTLLEPPADALLVRSLAYALVITRQFTVPGQAKAPLGQKPWKMPRATQSPAKRPTPAPAPASTRAPPVAAPASTRAPPVAGQVPRTPTGTFAVPGAMSTPTGAFAVPGAMSTPTGAFAVPGAMSMSTPTGAFAVPGAMSTPTGAFAVPGAMSTPTGAFAVPGAMSTPTGAFPVPGAPSPTPALKPTPKIERARKEDTIKEIVRIEQHLARKDIPTALRVATKAQQDDAHDPELTALTLWVKALGGGLKPPEAIDQLGRVLLDAPDCTRARLYRGKLYKRDNAKLREAVADFEQVLADDPANKDAAAELRLLRLMVKPGRL